MDYSLNIFYKFLTYFPNVKNVGGKYRVSSGVICDHTNVYILVKISNSIAYHIHYNKYTYLHIKQNRIHP